MKICIRSFLLASFVFAVVSPVIWADDDEAALKKLLRPGVRAVQEGKTLVELHTIGASDADLVGLNRFKSLRVLGLTNSQVTDAGLKHLAGMDSLQEIQLYNSLKIKGGGFKDLVGIKNLKRLWVDGGQINDEGLIALGGAGKLHTLWGQVGNRSPASDAEVDFFSLGSFSVTDASLKALIGLKSLQSLYLIGPTVSDKGMKDLAALTTLRVLSLRGAPLTDAGLSEIAGLKTLEVLHIDGARITDAGMKVIAGCKSLNTLFMDSPAVTGDGIRLLKGLPLHTFDPGRSLTDAKLRALADINRLHALVEARNQQGDRPMAPERVFSLDLIGQPVTGAELKELKALRSLQILRLNGTRVSREDLVTLAAIPSLAVVTLDDGLINDATLSLLRKHDLLHILAQETRRPNQLVKSLPYLNLANKPITDAGVKELSGINSIERLILSGTGVTDAGLKEIAAMPSLHTLSLDRTQVTDQGLKELAKFPALAELGLTGTKITDVGLKAFAGNKMLKRLDLGPKQVSDGTLRSLREIDMLHVLGMARSNFGGRPPSIAEIHLLVLNNTQVTDAGLKELVGCTGLETINVRNSKVTDAGIAELKKTLPNLHVLK